MKKNSASLPLDKIMAERFINYSRYIIQERALPDARDGLKPVQRRILYAMYELNLFHDKPFKKSARIVGEIIGKYHPHGDSSIYEALVRLSQDWKINHMLVEMHGNNGSIDDDPPAAMRYTETRLSKVSSAILEKIDLETVNFSPNFDDSETEPTILPALFPNLLVNGSKGIAAGYATSMPPHNLNEVVDCIIAYIENNNIDLKSLLKIIKGPDFPTGGIIYNIPGIKKAFETGAGKVIISSKYRILKKGKNLQLIIKEIPFGVNKAKLIRQIDSIRLQKQIDGIIDVIDQTDRKGISIAVEFENFVNTEKMINYFLSKTEMEISYHYNCISIVDKKPVKLTLIKAIEVYYQHQVNIYNNAINFKLQKANKKLEIIEGLVKLNPIIDEVIEIIKKTTNSKKGVVNALIKAFGFTENQADAIASLKLYRLSKNDHKLYLKEQRELKRIIKKYNILLNSKSKMDQKIITDLIKLKEDFGQKRKSSIKKIMEKRDVNIADLTRHFETYISISKDGYIKSFSKKIFSRNALEKFALKENDSLAFLKEVNTKDILLCFTNLGNYIFLPVIKIEKTKFKDFGYHISKYSSVNQEKIIDVILVKNFNLDFNLIFITKNAKIFKIKLIDFYSKRIKKAIKAIFLDDHDEVVNVKLSNNNQNLLLLTKNGQAIQYHENLILTSKIKSKKNSDIIIGMKLEENDYIVGMCLINNHQSNNNIGILTSRGAAKRFKINMIPISKSFTNNNIQIFKNVKSNPHLIEDINIINLDTNFTFLDEKNQLKMFSFKDIRLSNFQENFVNVLKMKKTLGKILKFDQAQEKQYENKDE